MPEPIRVGAVNYLNTKPLIHDLERIAPYAVVCQIKTEVHPAGKEIQEADLRRLLDILRKSNFRGYVALEYEAKEDAKRAIPALCFTEDDIREKFAQEEQWEEMSEDIQKVAIQSLMDASEYDNAAKLADEAITEAVARYLHDAVIEKEQRQEESEGP